MYTVYGIYEVGSDQVLYIGSTQSPIAVRFRQHVNAKRTTHAKKGHKAAVIARLEVFKMHREGKIKLEVRPISTHGSRQELIDGEFAAISEFMPPLNSSVGSFRNGYRAVTLRPATQQAA